MWALVPRTTLPTCRCRDHHQIGLSFRLFFIVFAHNCSDADLVWSSATNAPGGFSKPCGHQCQSATGRPAAAPGGRAARRVQSSRLHGLARRGRITTWSYRYMQLFWEAEHKTVAVLLNNIAYPTFQL